MPPGRQPYGRPRACAGIARVAPAGAWIIYRPSRDHRHVYVREVDQRRAGVIVLVRVFEWETGRFVRQIRPEDEPPEDDRPREERPRDEAQRPDRPPPRPREDPAIQRPPEQPPPDRPAVQRPPEQPPEERPPAERPPENKPPDDKPGAERPQGERPLIKPGDTGRGPAAPRRLDIPPGHLPAPGQCRIWIPGTPPGQQRHAASGDCAAVTRGAPAGSWVVYRPANGATLAHVRVIDERRPGTVVVVWVFDDGRFVRAEKP